MRSPCGRRSRLILASGSCWRHQVEGATATRFRAVGPACWRARRSGVRWITPTSQWSLEDQFVDLPVSIEAVGLQGVVRKYVDGVANHQRTADAAVGPGGCKAAELGESIRVGSQQHQTAERSTPSLVAIQVC